MNTPEEAIALHQKSINDRNLEEYIKTVIFHSLIKTLMAQPLQ